MTKDKWLDTIDLVEAKFGIDKNYKEPVGENIPGEKHIIEFKGPLGKMKLEWVEKAKLKKEKTVYSNRVGSDVKIYKIYDDKAMVNYMNVFKWDEIKEEWEEIDGGIFKG